ncbi:hypothetical protein FIBSPDRAFT_28719 [Athelia psychrophila]|uniref:BTB domain-containing protein n=1 Tax=Athelia psychrophila TaxID=1759441 RepID=A0A166G027_9AGAM|nr:hypothetical protein FIBSPDRAFT_28719 [Fibularhizoctonia sp. CBS 109695]
MSSPTSTTFDFPDAESDGTPPPRSPPPIPAFKSRHYIHGDVAVFKVEDHLFRINRAPLDKETNIIPRGKDPIELINIRPGDFDILLDFLNLGTRHDGKPLAVVDWASVIAVSSVLGMQRVLNLAYKTLSDQQNTQLNISRAGAGFDRATCGLYFLIREKGTVNHLGTYSSSNVEGAHLHLWP